MSLECMKNLKQLQDQYFFRLPHGHIIADYIWPGIVMSPKRILDIKEIEFGPDDIVIATYPKSGTTWMSELISALLYKGDIQTLRTQSLEARVPWLELESEHWWIKMVYQFERILRFFKPTIENCQTKPLKRVCFTHLPLELLPQSVIGGKCRIIYVARNPKDNAVSFFHHHRMGRFLGVQKNLSWNEFFALYIAGTLYCGSWFEHVLGFWEFSQLQKERVLFVKFEDMKQNLHEQVQQIIKFIDIELSEEQIQRVIDHCSFNSMKANKMTNRDIGWLFDQNVSKFMRKGEVGDWKNYFTLAQSELFDTLYEKEMQSVEGLNFRFE